MKYIEAPLTLLVVLFLITIDSYAQTSPKDRTTPFLTGGNLCPDYTFHDINGAEVKISSLRGKYIYIDVWASWCSACIAEMKDLHELQKDLEGANITFLSLSIDSNAAAYRRAVEKYNISAPVWLAAPDHPIAKDFDIRKIPRFILIDPNGIVIHNRMSRPGYPPTVELLKRLVGMYPEKP